MAQALFLSQCSCTTTVSLGGNAINIGATIGDWLNQFFSQLSLSFTAYNIKLLENLSEENAKIISKVPFFSFLFDIRILITLLGIITVALYFFKPKNDFWIKVRYNIRPIFMLCFFMKYSFSIIALIFYPAAFFTFSNVLFGIQPVLIYSLLIDLIVIYSLINIIKKEGAKTNGKIRDIISNTFDQIKNIVNSISSRKQMVTFACTILFTFILGRFFSNAQVSGFFSKLIPTAVSSFYASSISPTINLIFVDSWYPFTKFIDIKIENCLNWFVEKQFFLFSTLIKKASWIIKMLCTMALAPVYAKAIGFVLTFYIKFLEMFFLFANRSVSTLKQDLEARGKLGEYKKQEIGQTEVIKPWYQQKAVEW